MEIPGIIGAGVRAARQATHVEGSAPAIAREAETSAAHFVGRGDRDLQLGVAYLGSDPKDLREISKVADWVLLPMSEADLERNLPKVQRLVGAAHDGGTRVVLDPWRVGDVFAGEAQTTLAARFPGERQVSSDGVVRNSLSPLAPNFRQYMTKWLDGAEQVKADTVFWDEPHHWQGVWGGDERLYASVDNWHAAQFGKEFPKHATAETTAFETRVMGDLLLDLTADARSRGLGVYADFTPLERHRAIWERLAPHMDSTGVSAYEDLPRDIDMLRTSIGSNPGHVWVQGFRIPSGSENAIVRDGITQSYDQGAREIAVWSYRGSEAWKGLESGDAAASWQAVKDGFSAVRQLDAQRAAGAAAT